MVDRFGDLSRELGGELDLGTSAIEIADTAVNMTDAEMEKRIADTMKKKGNASRVGKWARMAFLTALTAMPALQAKAEDLGSVRGKGDSMFSELDKEADAYQKQVEREAAALAAQPKKEKEKPSQTAKVLTVTEHLSYGDQQAYVPKINLKAALTFPGRTIRDDNMLRRTVEIQAQAIGAERKALAQAEKAHDTVKADQLQKSIAARENAMKKNFGPAIFE